MKQIIILLTAAILTAGSFSQNINGKLGINGQFILRDTTNTFLTLSQNTGYLTLNRSLEFQQTQSSIVKKVEQLEQKNTDVKEIKLGEK